MLPREKVKMQADLTERFGLSRAVKAGNLIFISGTTASHPEGGAYHPGDAYEQAKVIYERMRIALEELGAGLEDIVQTMVYVTDMKLCNIAGKAHGEVFARIQPASATVEIGPLLHPDLVIEVTAIASLV